MKTQAQVVVIGAGIAGSSVAYHLTIIIGIIAIIAIIGSIGG